MKANTEWLGIAALSALLLAACGGEADTEAVTRSATTVGAVTHELTSVEFAALDSPLLAVLLDDGTETTATASAAIFEEVGLGADVLIESGKRVTWGGVYLIFLDDFPETVLLEETGTGEWLAVSVDE